MKCNILKYLLIVACISCGFNLYGQGLVTRPTNPGKPNKPEKSAPQAIVCEPNGYINGKGYVDLGLPSGLKWATCNVGALRPSDYGDYFAWGETSAKSSYTVVNSLTYGKTVASLKSEGIINSLRLLNKRNDAATYIWGELWRMPTKAEFEELLSKCKWTWTTNNGHNGYIVTGPNGNSIFLPAAGRRYSSSLDYAGEIGYYWSSSVDSGADAAYCSYFNSSNRKSNWSNRYSGLSIRPVSK